MGRTACTEPQCLYKGTVFIVDTVEAMKAYGGSTGTHLTQLILNLGI